MKKNSGTIALIVALSALTLGACSATHTVREPTRSALELQQIQSRDFEAPFKTTFSSVLSVLQDTGYIIESADSDTGFITGKSPSNSNTTYDLFWGLGSRHKATMVTAFIEPIGQAYSRVRLNFVGMVQKSSMYGMSSQVDTPIEDETVYKNAFEKIDETIFIRLSLNAPAAESVEEASGATNTTIEEPDVTAISE